ncbi:MAG: TRAP transporter small permease subunit [Pseudomonadota bacterium]
MSGSARPIIPAIIAVVFAFLAIESYIEALFGAEEESFLGEIGHLWRPVFLAITLTAVLICLARTGYGTAMRSISGALCGAATAIGKFASWIILPLIGIIMLDVITRKIEVIKVANAEITQTYGFSVSFILQDFQWHLHGVLLLMTFGFGYMLNAHVRVDIFREGLSRTKQAWVETFGLTILAVPFMLVMIGFSWDLFYASFVGWEGSESMVGLGWRWIIKSFLIWGFVVALMAAVGTLMRCILFLYGDYEDQAVAEDDLQFFTDNDSMSKLILEQNKDASVGGSGS